MRVPESDDLRVTPVEAVVAASRVEYAPGASADIRDYRVDFRKIRRVLPEFMPQWTVQKGIEQLYEAYKRQGLTADTFLGGRYVRLSDIKRLQGARRLDGDLRWIDRASTTEPAGE